MRADDPRLLGLGSELPEMLVAIGFVEETDDHRYANSAALLRGGRLIGLHRKVYLPTYGLFDEGRFTRPGDSVRTHEVGPPIGRIGLSVCEDFWHASLPMLQAQDGADLLVNIAAGPSRAPGSAAGTAAIAGWHKMQDTYALLGTVGDRLLQPGRQRGGPHLLGRLPRPGRRWLDRGGGAAVGGGAGGRQPRHR